MNCKKSINRKVKQLRKQRAWSQSHLAEAAGLSTRTIQRLEQTGNCSDETLLSIAAALDIDIEELTTESNINFDSSGNQAEYLWGKFTPKISFRTGLFLLIPGALFVISNVLKYELNLPWLYDSLAMIGNVTGLFWLSGFFTNPFFLLSTLFIALILGVLSQVQVKGSRSGKELTIREFEFSLYRPSSLMLIISFLVITILIGYAATENIADWVIMILDQKL